MSQLTQESLRADFLKACKETPQLEPLQTLYQLVEKDELDNTNLFSLLWSIIHNDSELKEAYKRDVHPEMDRAARIFVAENPPLEEHRKFLSVSVLIFYSSIRSI
jgi:surfactin synthase thioesterase subunit